MRGKKNRVDLKKINELRIPYFGLTEGVHEFKIEVRKEFFDSFVDSGIFDSDLDVTIKIDKMSGVTTADVSINGTVDVECDRCLDVYSQDIEFQGSVKIKIGTNAQEGNDELWIISGTEDFIDFTQYVYESTILSLPIQRIHQDDEEGESTCNPEMLERYEQLVSVDDEDFDFGFDDDDDIDLEFDDEEEDDESDDSDDDIPCDPRWDALKRLK